MDIKQEPLDNNKTTNIVKAEDGYHYDENTNVAGLGNCDFQHTTLKEETLDIDEKPVMGSLEDESVKMKCDTCGQVYNLKQSFIERAGITVNEELFRCSFCECKAGRMHACNICSFKAKIPSHLVNHMLIHTGEKPFACSICEYRTLHKYTLTKHIMEKHTVEKPFTCSICEYSTSHKYELTKHMRKHKNSFACSICDYSTLYQYKLLHKHMRTHRRPLACSICEYRTSLKYRLTMHMRKHAVEKLYECGLCNYKTLHAWNIKRHENVQHKKI